MAYNFKNALVNLNEEIRKGGGGGGQIAADVAALKASVIEIRSSVAGINQDVDTIKATLRGLLGYSSEETVIGTYSGKDVVRAIIIFESDLSVSYTTWTDTNISSIGKGLIFEARGIGSNLQSVPLLVSRNNDKIQFQTGRNGTNQTVQTVILEYVKEVI